MLDPDKKALYDLMDQLESAASQLGGLGKVGMVQDLHGNNLPEKTARTKERLKHVIRNIEAAIAALDEPDA